MKEHFVEIDGKKTHFFRKGKGSFKLVILHGWDQNMNITESYTPLLQALEKDNFLEKFEVILPHFPGFGKSDVPDTKGWNTTDYAIWLEKFLEKIEIRTPKKEEIVFFSHSFGGRVLTKFLLRNPHYCDKVILSASAGIKWPLSIRQKLSLFLSKKCTRAKALLPQKIQKIILNRILGARDWGAVKESLKPTLKKVVEESDFRDQLPNIKTKVLLLWGAQDKTTPLKSGKVFATQLPNSQLKIFEDGRHGIHKTHAKKMAKEIMAFLK